MIKLKNRGFSLIEAMVGLGLMTAVGVGVMQLQSNQVKTQKSIDVDYEVKILSSVIADHIKNKAVCENTFAGRNFGSTFDFTQIVDGGGNTLFALPQDFRGQNNIQILKFTAEPRSLADLADPTYKEGAVRIAFEYKKSSSVLKNDNTYKHYISLPIQVKTDASGVLHSCITASDSAIETSLNRFCISLNGTFHPETELCELSSFPGISAGESFQGVSSQSFASNMWPAFFDRYVNRNSDSEITGNVIAEKNIILGAAPVNPMHAITKSFLDSQIKCEANQVGVMTSAGLACRNMTCTNLLEYAAGINPDGSLHCLSLLDVDKDTCSEGGGRLIVTGGKVGFECCTPDCSAEGTMCTGTSFLSANECGMCEGTAPEIINGTWTPWLDSGETRQTSECIGNQIQTEKKQTRTCIASVTPLSCQEITCSGSDEQWVAGTPINCGGPVGVCQGSGSDTAGLFPNYQADTEVRNGCQTQYRIRYFEINTAKFKRGNIYSIISGTTYSTEVGPSDTPTTVLDRLVALINAAPVRTEPSLCYGSGNHVLRTATRIASNRIQFKVGWQSVPGQSASRSCNDLSETECGAATGCNWNTTSPNVCLGWNYQIPQGTCKGNYTVGTCMWNGGGGGYGGTTGGYGGGGTTGMYNGEGGGGMTTGHYSQPCIVDPYGNCIDLGGGGGSDPGCQYMYSTQAACQAASSQGCYWGYQSTACYASNAAACSALGGSCSWTSYPNQFRSCTGAYGQSQCTTDGAGVCTWEPRE